MIRFELVGKGYFDLYKEETIVYTQKTQDFNELGVSYGDFSQEISIPATSHNLSLIDFYNQSQVINGFNPFADAPINMYMDEILYATGDMKINSITHEGTVPIDISIQFFADLSKLKAALTDQGTNEPIQIKSLNLWDNMPHEITRDLALDYLCGTFPTSRVDGSPLPLRYPMASQENVWTWQGATFEGVRRIHRDAPNYTGSDTDIGILASEIRPAVQVSTIVDAIFALAGYDYAIAFNDSRYYSDLWMWIANGKSLESIQSTITEVQVPKQTRSLTGPEIASDLPFSITVQDTQNAFNQSSNIFTAQATGSYNVTAAAFNNATVNPNIFYRYTKNVSGVVTTIAWTTGNAVTVEALTIGDTIYDIEFQAIAFLMVTYVYNSAIFKAEASVLPLQTVISPVDFMPKITCEYFLLGILNAFNAVMWWDGDKYQIEHRTQWFRNGKTVDVSQEVDTDKIIMSPPRFYKSLAFNFEEAQDFRNIEYAKSVVSPYGFSKYANGYKFGEVAEIRNPFTASFWQEVVSVDSSGVPFDFGLGVPSFQCVEPAGDAVEPGVRLMYFNTGGGTNGTTGAMGTYSTADDTGVNGTGSTLFHKFTNADSVDEVSFSYKSDPVWQIDSSQNIPNYSVNLYNKFFAQTVGAMYNKNTRLYRVTAYLKKDKLFTIELNDTIRIGGKDYYINTMEIDFTTGKTEFELVTKTPFESI